MPHKPSSERPSGLIELEASQRWSETPAPDDPAQDAPAKEAAKHAPSISVTPRITLSIYLKQDGVNAGELNRGFAEWSKSQGFKSMTRTEWDGKVTEYFNQKV